MYRILSVSRNVRLLLQRNDALALAGFSVVSPRSPEEAPMLLVQQGADAVVIGHSVKPEERAAIIEQIRQDAPGCLIVFVYAGPDGGGEPLADVSLDVTDGPQSLIQVLQEKLPRTAAAD